MDRSEVIKLQSVTKTQDAYGVWREVVTERDVFCQVNSVTRSEFFEGGRNGLNPEFRMTMFAGDYNDEKTLVYRDKTYSVYRTYYGRNDTIELYVERKGGSNGRREVPDGQENQAGGSEQSG